jgi:hypothetical protein
MCLERASSEGFTVPAWVLWQRAGAADALEVQVRHFTRQEFAAPGIDFGEFTYTRQVESVRKPIGSSRSN